MRDNNSHTRLKVSALAVLACITCLAPISARKPSESNKACPTISCESSTSVQPIQFTIDGGSNNTTYLWTVSLGDITSGQGTNQISVSGVPVGQSCEATVTMTGIPTGCSEAILTCKTTISPTDVVLLARYDRRSSKQEIDQSLEKMVTALARDSQLVAYIVVYPGGGNTASIDSLHPFFSSNQTANPFNLNLRNYNGTRELFALATFQQPGQGTSRSQRPNKEVDDPLPEAKRFADYARKYLIDRGVAPDRLKVQFGPAKQILTLELYVGRRGGNLPSLYHPRTTAGTSSSSVLRIDTGTSLMEEGVCKDIFGGDVSKKFYCIQVALTNATNYRYQVRGLAFTGSGGNSPSVPLIPIATYAMVRNIIKPSPFRSVWQVLFFTDKSSFYLKALDDHAFRNDVVTRTTFLRENSSVTVLVFVQKNLLNLGAKGPKDHQLVFRELGDLVVDGDFYTSNP